MNDIAFSNPENELSSWINSAQDNINCAKVGTIMSVNGDGTADVELLDGTKANCLLFLFSGDGKSIDFENYAGSYCLVIFCDDDLTRFKTQNGALRSIDARKHTLNNGIALSGIFPFGGRKSGNKHFVSFEELDGILGEWSDNLLKALKAATVPQTASGTPAPITFLSTSPLPNKIGISSAKIGGIVYG